MLVHVTVEGVRLPDPTAADGFLDRITHLPLTAAAVDASVTRLVAEDEAVPPFADAYRRWREGFDTGRWGLFGESVAEAVEAADRFRAK